MSHPSKALMLQAVLALFLLCGISLTGCSRKEQSRLPGRLTKSAPRALPSPAVGQVNEPKHAEGAAPEGALTIAVSYFDNDSEDPDLEPLKKGLAHMIATDLAGLEGARIVERERLAEVLSEIKLGKSPYIDPGSAQKLGRGLGASHILTGSYLVGTKVIRIDVRLIEVATGKVALTASSNGNSDDIFKLETRLVEQLRASLARGWTRSGKARIAVERAISLAALQELSQGLDSLDRGDRVRAHRLIREALRRSKGLEPADVGLDELTVAADRAVEMREARSANIPAQLVGLAEKLRSGDRAGCALGFKLIEALGKETGELKPGARLSPLSPLRYVMLEYLLSAKINPKLCPQMDPALLLLDGAVSSLGTIVGSEDDSLRQQILQPMGLIRDLSGAVQIEIGDLDALFIRYAHIYLRRYPDGPLVNNKVMGRGLPEWIKTVAARIKRKRLAPAARAAAEKGHAASQALMKARRYFSKEIGVRFFVFWRTYPGTRGSALVAALGPMHEPIFAATKTLEVSFDSGKRWQPWPTASTHTRSSPAAGGLSADVGLSLQYIAHQTFGRGKWHKAFVVHKLAETLAVRVTLVDGSVMKPFICPAIDVNGGTPKPCSPMPASRR